VAVIVAVLAAVCSACSADAADGERATVLVATRVIPRGQLVQDAADTDALRRDDVPAALARDGTLTGVTDDVRCLVAAWDIPQGAVLRRSMLSTPAELGLDEGLAVSGTAPPTCA
jgi:Flp pilus assembly protein CpaB